MSGWDSIDTNAAFLQIFADDIVESVSTLTQLRTFGFSLDGNVDLDLNRHAGNGTHIRKAAF